MFNREQVSCSPKGDLLPYKGPKLQSGRGRALVLPKDPLFSSLFKDSTERGPDLLHIETTVHRNECVPVSVHGHACTCVHT